MEQLKIKVLHREQWAVCACARVWPSTAVRSVSAPWRAGLEQQVRLLKVFFCKQGDCSVSDWTSFLNCILATVVIKYSIGGHTQRAGLSECTKVVVR